MPPDLADALARTWPPFALIAGLLLLGGVAGREGLFAWLGGLARRGTRSGLGLVAGLYVVTAAVTAVLNLDTAVAFVAPVAVHACRARGVDPVPVAVGVLLMANASSLLLPGANLTNLLVLADAPIDGHRWLLEVAPAGAAAAVLTGVGLVALDRLALRRSRAADGEDPPVGPPAGRPPAAVLVLPVLAGAAILAVPDPALAVLTLGVLATLGAVLLGRTGIREAVRALGPAALVGLLVAATALGWLARAWGAPAVLLAELPAAPTAALGAAAAVLVNNLPAAALLSAGDAAHPEALLAGLNLGPNLLPTGSLAAWLWWRAVRGAGLRPTPGDVLRRGPLLAVPALALATALLA